jgi:hypothetical protein
MTSIGEIDLVVLYDNEAVAICEMKSSCFELAGAFRQHEPKLCMGGTAAGDASISTASVCIGPTSDCIYWQQQVGETPNSSSTLPIFVVTLMPDTSNGTVLLGAEPALAYAICDGIRSQGCKIADASILDDDDAESSSGVLWADPINLEAALAYLDSFPPSRSCDSSSLNNGNDYLDYDELKRHVMQKMNRDQLEISPAGCFQQNSDHILVLPRDSC